MGPHSRSREECTRLLTLLVGATNRLIKPYAIPMLKVLLPKANDPNPIVAANILMCLGELTRVGGEEVLPHVPELMQVIMVRLADASLPKRDAALHTLGQVCSSTGYVVSPLIDYPQLLQILSRILRTETKQAVRREIIKVLGILGALDPYRRKASAHIAVLLGSILIARGRLSQMMKPRLPNWRTPTSSVLRRGTPRVSARGRTITTRRSLSTPFSTF